MSSEPIDRGGEARRFHGHHEIRVRVHPTDSMLVLPLAGRRVAVAPWWRPTKHALSQFEPQGQAMPTTGASSGRPLAEPRNGAAP